MNLLVQFKSITTFFFDMDGVLTDGKVLLTEDGAWLRSMNTKDGFALQLAIKKGFRIIVVSGSICQPAAMRLKKLGITEVHMDVKDKDAFVEKYMTQHHLSKEEVLFMGDDVPDYMAMKLAGLSCCPADAVDDVKQISTYISPYKGGAGCVRDVIEKVLKLNNKWELDTNIPSK